MKKFTLLFALLFAVIAPSQTINRAPINNVITYTTADINLFVDPTGNDSNACTLTGTAACLTIQGALAKVPKALRHQPTVTAACGTYAGATVSGFSIDPAFQKTSAGILIQGPTTTAAAMTNVTPTTGNATGTATGGTAGSGNTYGTLVDSGATWTINDSAFVGKFIVITGGTGSGQVFTIASNTATTLNIAGRWTAPTASSTYAIQKPCVVISTGVAGIPRAGGSVDSTLAAGFQVVDNVQSVARITFKNLAVSAPSFCGFAVASPSIVRLTQVTVDSFTSIGVFATLGAEVTMDLSSIVNPTVTRVGFDVDKGYFAAAGIATSVISTTTPILVTGNSSGNIDQTVLITSGSSHPGIQLDTGGNIQITTLNCDCRSSGNSACLAVTGGNAVSVGSSGGASAITVTGGVGVTNCDNGINIYAGGRVDFRSGATLTGNALVNALYVAYGGRAVVDGAPTITGALHQISVDGQAFANFADLATSLSCVTNLSTASGVCRL